MDNTTLEHYLAHYCAATLLGEKSASLVSLPREECARIGLQLREYNRQLGPKGLVLRCCAPAAAVCCCWFTGRPCWNGSWRPHRRLPCWNSWGTPWKKTCGPS